MEQRPKIPKDLGIKIGTKNEALWTAVLKNADAAIEDSKNAITVQSEVKKLAEKKIAEEKKKN